MAIAAAVLWLLVAMAPVQAQSFGYVGVLARYGAAVADGDHDFRVRLFDAAEGGSELAPAVELPAVPVEAGAFALQLDFGDAVLAAPAAWLQLEVRGVGEAGYDVQQPRQRLTGVPLAFFSDHAGSVAWAGIEGVPAGFADGIDADALAALQCGEGETPRFVEATGQWTCGAAARDGRGVLSGDGAPAADLGADGDFYIDTLVPALYGPKSAGAWGAATALVGPQGVPGPTGPQGASGPQGPQGEPGLAAGETPYPAQRIGRIEFSDAPIQVEPGLRGLPVHAFSSSLHRPVTNSGSRLEAGPPVIDRVSVDVDPVSAVALLARLATGVPFEVGTATLWVGTPEAEVPLLQLGKAAVTRLELRPASDGSRRDLARVELAFGSWRIERAGEAFAFDVIANQTDMAPGADCTGLLQDLAYTDPVFWNTQDELLVELPHDALTSERDWVIMGDRPNVLPPIVAAPQLRIVLPGGTASGGVLDHAAVCAAALVFDRELPASTLRRRIADGVEPWSIAWETLWVSQFAISSRPDGSLQASWRVEPSVVRVHSGGTSICFDRVNSVSC